LCWQKYHWEHYSLVKGYDSSNDLFIIFDDNNKKYGEYCIPRIRFVKAVSDCSLEIDAYLVKYGKTDNYNLDFNEVLKNANRLVHELKGLFGNYWQVSDKDIEGGYMFELFSSCALSISNRHLANLKLIKRLYANEFISKSKYIKLVDKFKGLIKGWDIIKNRFIIGNISVPRKLDYLRINECKNLLINDEIKAWMLLINNENDGENICNL